MRIGLFGGAFNPIHNGHLHLANAAKEELKLDRVLFVPCYKYAFDTKNLSDSSIDRTMMVSMSMDEDNNQICTVEYEARGVSYTIDTVKELKKVLNKHYLCLICGPDVRKTIDKWKDIDKLREEIDIKHAGIDFDVTEVNIRSSMIRDLVKCSKSITGLVPPRVESWINRRGLYG